MARLRTLGPWVALVAILATFHQHDRPVAAQAPDTVNALLVEVRGLRAALEQLASAGPRVQLLFGRLQLHEQRIAGYFRRLEVLRDRINDAEREAQQMSEQVTRMESELKTAPNAAEREHLENSLPMGRRELSRIAATINALKAEEASLNSEIAVEQGRWTELNQRLEDLERALTRR